MYEFQLKFHWSLFCCKGLINNIPALVWIMACHRPGDKPLYEPMMVTLLTHICVTRPQWVNSLRPSDAYICVGKLATISWDNGLSPGRRQAIISTNAGILLNGPLWTNFSEILIEIPTFSFKKMRLKVSSAKWRPCCFGLNVLICTWFCCGYHRFKWMFVWSLPIYPYPSGLLCWHGAMISVK